MMLFGFGRVPGCLGLGALFFVGWREGRMDSLPAGRWMAARAEFPCGLTGGECGIGAALDACGWDWCCGGGFVEGLCQI